MLGCVDALYCRPVPFGSPYAVWIPADADSVFLRVESASCIIDRGNYVTARLP